MRRANGEGIYWIASLSLKLNTNMPISKLRMNDGPIFITYVPFFTFREQLKSYIVISNVSREREQASKRASMCRWDVLQAIILRVSLHAAFLNPLLIFFLNSICGNAIFNFFIFFVNVWLKEEILSHRIALHCSFDVYKVNEWMNFINEWTDVKCILN